MTVEQAIGEPRDQFPVGMRVLAVDDDPTCLLLLESLLRRCQYHVTTTSQAITALKMLRENKNKFDLVISDVHMPDMDGFKLLELVGLEMDLPVIMLSANGDTKLVMKGISHGACDYLLKPVRIEELKNIWQHVVRRRKFDAKDTNTSNSQDRAHGGNGEAAGMANSDQNGKLNKKRKDQNEDDDEDHDENGHENEDPSTQKKPRVVWSVELHRKFVAAVNQLGIDKAVPKKILDLMNVEKLTRENVASHLQKYRLYLKRISCVSNQQANMAAALSSTDSLYLNMGPLNGLGNFHNVGASAHLHNTSFRSFPPSGMLGRLNSSAALGMRGLPSSGVIQLGHAQNPGNTANDQAKFQPITLPGNHSGSILQGMPTSLELGELQPNRGVSRIGEIHTAIDDMMGFPVSSGFPDSRITVNNMPNPLLGVSNNHLVLESCLQEDQSGKLFGNQSSVLGASLSAGTSSCLPDPARCSNNWSGTVQSSGVQPHSFPLGQCFKQPTFHPTNTRESMSRMSLQMGNNQSDMSSISPVSIQPKADLQCQAAPMSRNSGQVINSISQEWDDRKQDAVYHSSTLCSSVSSEIPFNGAAGPLSQNLDPDNALFCGNMDFDLIGQSNFLDTSSIKHTDIVNPTMETSLNLKEGYLLGQPKTHSSYISNNVGSLDDLVSAVVKQEQGEHARR